MAEWLDVTGDGTVVGTWKAIVAYFTQQRVACVDTDYLDAMRSVDLSAEAATLGVPLPDERVLKAKKLAVLRTHLHNLDQETLREKNIKQLNALGDRLGIEGLSKKRSQNAKLDAILSATGQGGRRVERCVLVLDEVDFFFEKKKGGTKGGVRLAGQAAQGVPAVTHTSSCADVVAALVGLALSKANTHLVTVLISNEETEAHQAIRMIPKELRLHFAPYNKEQVCKFSSVLVCEYSRRKRARLPPTTPPPSPSHPFPSLPFPSLPFPSLPFPSLPFPSLPFPSLPFPSLPFPSLPFPSLPFPSLPLHTARCTAPRHHLRAASRA